MSTGVTYSKLGSLRQTLAEAARTDESNADQAIARFVELRPGLKDTLCSRRHHLLAGRRGTGKSTLLHVVRQELRQAGAPIAVIDMERFKGRPFPDVLIEILIALLDEMKPRVRSRTVLRDLRLRRRFRTTRRELDVLLRDPQSLTKQLKRGEQASRQSSAGGAARIAAGASTGYAGADLSLGAGAQELLSNVVDLAVKND